jgi:hypothetical protein
VCVRVHVWWCVWCVVVCLWGGGVVVCVCGGGGGGGGEGIGRACLGISLVRVGGSVIFALKPKKAPTKTRGVLMPNHMRSSASIVPRGMAPEDAWPQMKKLSTKKAPTTTPGHRSAVMRVAFFHSVPLTDLYVCAEK